MKGEIMNRDRHRFFFTSLLACVIASSLASPSVARADRLDELHNELIGPDVSKAVKAAGRLGRMRSDKALKVLMETLLLGAPPKLSRALIEAIGRHGNASSFELLAHYTKNRDKDVRAEALEAVGRISEPKYRERIFDLALRALRDGASKVRATGARLLVDLKKAGLGEERVLRAEKVLLSLLLVRKDQLTAKIGLSQLGGARTARALAIHLNDELRERIVTTLYAAFLKRADFGPEPVRVWIVRTLEKLTGPEAIAALMDYVASASGKKTTPSVALARKIAER
jgi:hypothetical protein